MNIIRASHGVYFNFDALSETLFVTVPRDQHFIVQNNTLRYYRFGEPGPLFYGTVRYQGSMYNVFIEGSSGVNLQAVTDGCLYYVDAKGERLDLKPEISLGLYKQTGGKAENRFVAFILADYPKKYQYSICVCDLDEDTVVTVEFDVDLVDIFDGKVVGCDSKNAVSCFDLNLNQLWYNDSVSNWRFGNYSFRSQYPTHFAVNNSLFFNLGSSEPKPEIRDGAQFNIYRNGRIASFAIDDGKLLWQAEFEYQVDDCLLFENRLFVATFNQLIELDPSTGERLHVIDTGLRRDSWYGTPCELYAEDNYLFYPSNNECCVLVYALDTLECIRRIDLPDRWSMTSLQFKDPRNKDRYFRLLVSPGGPPVCHRQAVLKLNLDTFLDEEADYEPQPQTTIELRDASDEVGKKELWVELHGPSLDDALRFGELHTQNYASIYCYQLHRWCEPTPEFNGKVHFRYSGCDQSAELVQEKLKIMEERFTKWATEEGMHSSDNSRVCELDAQYLG